MNDPHVVDAHVGARIKQIRTFRGISQESLGERLGVSFQQVQKYENGANRVSASKLYIAADALSVPVAALFDGLKGVGEVIDLPTFSYGDIELAKRLSRLERQDRDAVARIVDGLLPPEELVFREDAV